MINDKSQLEKRIKYLRISHISSIVLIFISIAQIIFEPRDGFISYWFVLILWMSLSIVSWFDLKKAKNKLKENQIE